MSVSETSILTKCLHLLQTKLPLKVLKYSFVHFSLLKNNLCHSPTDRFTSGDGKIWCLQNTKCVVWLLHIFPLKQLWSIILVSTHWDLVMFKQNVWLTLWVLPEPGRCCPGWWDESWCPVSPVWHRWDRCTSQRTPSSLPSGCRTWESWHSKPEILKLLKNINFLCAERTACERRQ